MKKKRAPKTMEEITKGHEEFMKGKELREDGQEMFEELLDRSSSPKRKKKIPAKKK